MCVPRYICVKLVGRWFTSARWAIYARVALSLFKSARAFQLMLHMTFFPLPTATK